MKKQICSIVVAALCFSTISMAQITTGEPTAKVVKTGNRAQEGDFGVYFGATSTMFKPLFEKNADYQGFLPLINIKYMVSDNLEARIGLEFSKESENVAGDFKVGTETANFISKNVEARNMIYPGIAYHFNSSNLLDVYTGVEIPLGYVRESAIRQNDKDTYNNTSKFAFNAGLGAFIGLQAYVADLPVAIGIEYGIASLYSFGDKYKHTNKLGAGNDEVITYSTDLQNGVSGFDKINTATKGDVGSQFRITVSYFFR